MLPAKNSLELLKSIEVENLYVRLIEQLNKDFHLANVPISFDVTNSPVQLKKQLFEVLLNLITNQYDDYLNLLYRIDVAESELAKLKNNNLTTSIEEIAYLVLKREYQKVWFKQNFDKI
ncbi:MAG: hypothetical protein CVU08_09915 [Bacteroidetes bacterium HGW-Bacteroidetes-3]|jgi:hypothetical protein|nr:MAG: hypothetical protein CVU08_09915 [Bacteroidetes bacterium HGW-Bacteroidetes-3]